MINLIFNEYFVIGDTMTKILKVLKKIIISSFLVYGYNLLVQPLNITLPINIVTVLLVSFLGIPALFSLILILIYIY